MMTNDLVTMLLDSKGQNGKDIYEKIGTLPKDSEEYLYCLKIAAERGSEDALFDLSFNDKLSQAQRDDYLLQSASKGNHFAQCSVAISLLQSDKSAAFDLFISSATKGNKTAKEILKNEYDFNIHYTL